MPYGGLKTGSSLTCTEDPLTPIVDATLRAGHRVNIVTEPLAHPWPVASIRIHRDKSLTMEDLVTSGGSVVKAIEPLQTAGLRVSDVAVLIDRQQGGRDNLAAQGYRLHAALTLPDILNTLQAAGRISAEQVEIVRQYLSSSKG